MEDPKRYSLSPYKRKMLSYLGLFDILIFMGKMVKQKVTFNHLRLYLHAI